MIKEIEITIEIDIEGDFCSQTCEYFANYNHKAYKCTAFNARLAKSNQSINPKRCETCLELTKE